MIRYLLILRSEVFSLQNRLCLSIEGFLVFLINGLPQSCKSRRASESRRLRVKSRSSLLRTLSNAEYEVLRLSRRGNNMAKSTPILRIHQWRYPRICHFDMIFKIIADHYLIFAMLFMQLRGLFNFVGHGNHPGGIIRIGFFE